jgi:hypothetical protein
MLFMDLPAALAAERSRELARAAESSRLIALSRCCRPSSRRRAAARLSEAFSVVRGRLSRPRPGATCCVGA